MCNFFLKKSKNIMAGLVFVSVIIYFCAVAGSSMVRGFTTKGAGDALGAADWNALRNDFLAVDGDMITNNSMLGDLDMGGSSRITDVGDPSPLSGTDGASRQWVLAQIAAVTGGAGGSKIVCGSTPTGQWVSYTSGAISVTVDTRSSTLGPNFSATPLYLTSLGGTSNIFRASNAVTVVSPNNTGFIAVIDTGGVFTPAFANTNNWVISWCGVGL